MLIENATNSSCPAAGVGGLFFTQGNHPTSFELIEICLKWPTDDINCHPPYRIPNLAFI